MKSQYWNEDGWKRLTEDFMALWSRADTRVVDIRTEQYEMWIGGKDRKKNLPNSPFRNPFPITNHQTRSKSIGLYFWHLVQHPEIVEKLPSLYGKVLGCYGPPKATHGDLLVHLCQGAFPKIDELRWWQACTECHAPAYFWRREIDNPAHYITYENPYALDPGNYTYLNGVQVIDQEKVYCPCCQVLTGAMFDVSQMRCGRLDLASIEHLRQAITQ